jgi:chitinase
LSVVGLLIACGLGIAMLAAALGELPGSGHGGSPPVAGPPAGSPTAVEASPAPQPVTGVVNGGFETGSLSPWTCTGNLGTVVSYPVHSGRFALAGAVNNSDNVQCSETVRVQPGRGYTLSAWVRGAYVFIGVIGPDTGNPSMWTPGSSSYTPLSVAFTTGPGTTTVTVFVHGWYAQGAYNADDISLT